MHAHTYMQILNWLSARDLLQENKWQLASDNKSNCKTLAIATEAFLAVITR